MSRFVTAFIALVIVSVSDLFPSLRPTLRAAGDHSDLLANGLLAGTALLTAVAPAVIIRRLLRPALETSPLSHGGDADPENPVVIEDSTSLANPIGVPPTDPPLSVTTSEAPQPPLPGPRPALSRPSMPRSLGRLKRARKLTNAAPFFGLITLLALGAREASFAWVPPQIAGGAALLLLLPFAIGWYLAIRAWTRFELRIEGLEGPVGAIARREFRAPFLIFCAFVTMSALRDLTWMFPEWREIAHTHPLASIGGIVFSLVCMVLLSPTAVGLLHPKRPLPPGDLRDQFEQVANAARTRLGRVDVWDTGTRPALNACVAGAIPRFRRVFFTDGLIDTLENDELAGVFAHELAHSKLHHLWIYIGLIVGLSGIALGLEDGLAAAIASGRLAPFPPSGTIELGIFLALGFFFFRFFGVLSRHLESQADIFSARTTGAPWGIISALNKIGRLTGTLDRRAGWRHPAIPDRIRTVLEWWENPEKQKRFRKRTRRLLFLWGAVFLLGIAGGSASLRTAFDRPEWRQSFDRAEFLIVSIHERRDRPWSDRAWEIEQSERARALLVTALEDLPVDSGTMNARFEIFRTLAHCYRLLEDPYSAAMADYFSLPGR